MANPIVTITMDNGDVMKAELYPEVAPNTVNNFISLVKKGFYDGLIFHRVINGSRDFNSKMIDLERSAPFTSKYGFSVVAPIRMMVPSSTKGRR